MSNNNKDVSKDISSSLSECAVQYKCSTVQEYDGIEHKLWLVSWMDGCMIDE